jgi:predicted nuclease with RNAse H fold
VIAAVKNQFVGIDLTSSGNKPSACAALDADLSIIRVGLLSTDPEIVATMDKIQPAIVAIDAPLSLPKGLCCLEQGCSCGQALPLAGRACERELARLGIPCFFTTKRSIIKAMVYRAIALSSELSGRGYEVIEIYPHASKVRLFGKSIPSKLTPAGLTALRARVAALMPNLASKAAELSHDLCDALIAAYTAYLYARGMAEPVGDAEEGLIFIPKLQVQA